MPLCGFDKQMLDGLDSFYRGLARAVIRKSKEKNVTVEEAISLELKDMDNFLRELVLLDDGLNKHKLVGITHYARAFYLGVLRYSKEKDMLIKDAMGHQISETRKFLFDIDNYYYQYLEGKTGKPMLELVHYIQRM